MINHFFEYEFVYVFFFCSIAFLIISMFVKFKAIKKITILLFSLFFVLSCFEFILSFFMIKIDSIYHKSHIFDKGFSNIIKQKHIKIWDNGKLLEVNDNNINKYKNCYIVFNSEYSLYPNEFRFTKCNEESEDIYVFLGCSFLFGAGMNDDETLPYFFSKKFNFTKNVINCGVSGESTNTALNIINNNVFMQLIKNKDSKINHFFYYFIYDHIYRNFRFEEKAMASDGYLYKNKKWYIPTKIGKIKYIFARSYIFRKIFVPIIDEYFEQYYEDYIIKSLEQMNEIIEKKYNSKLTIVIWPDNYDKNFIRKLKEINLDLIYLPDYFNSEEEKYKIKYDKHPTAKANEEIAQILYNHINVLE